jgi:hypothetical protein
VKKTAETSGGRPRPFRDVLSGQLEAVRVLAQKLPRLVMVTLPVLTESAYGGGKATEKEISRLLVLAEPRRIQKTNSYQ